MITKLLYSSLGGPTRVMMYLGVIPNSIGTKSSTNKKFIIDLKIPLDGATSIDDYWILISFEDSMLKIK